LKGSALTRAVSSASNPLSGAGTAT